MLARCGLGGSVVFGGREVGAGAVEEVVVEERRWLMLRSKEVIEWISDLMSDFRRVFEALLRWDWSSREMVVLRGLVVCRPCCGCDCAEVWVC